ncbi:T3SS effector HopA1 family protein [Pokkaliibacter plantistimulans]|uniref:T3SS effector HopA1 family protein n=1 Tax=Pokkaliibacter plantistimulans TaxID=1635171 RepID=UPI000D740FC4|nr:T3SS effector HopA1 family protein [Pokkaliibacter plantistimulans]
MVNTVDSSHFQSVDELQRSTVTVPELLQHGKLKVDGKRYSIKLDSHSELHVSPSAFKGMKGLFKSESSKAESAATGRSIAAVIEDKARQALSRHVAETAASSLAGASSTADYSALVSMLRCAESADALRRLRGLTQPVDVMAVYNQITAKPRNQQMTFRPKDQQHVLDEMCQLQEPYQGRVWIHSQLTDGREGVSLRDYVNELRGPDRVKAFAGNIRFFKQATDGQLHYGESGARVSLAVKPEFCVTLGKVLVQLCATDPDIREAKLISPRRFGSSADSAVIYLGPDLHKASQVAERVRRLLPEEAFADHAIAGMQPLAKGCFYGELTKADMQLGGSLGLSRAAIISEVLNTRGNTSMEQRLRSATERRGYEPDNPAFMKSSKFRLA